MDLKGGGGEHSSWRVVVVVPGDRWTPQGLLGPDLAMFPLYVVCWPL